jgi:uncharacterized coiled-coil DUF342 family protein
MAEKDFIRHTKPKGKRQIAQTIADLDKQIHYWQSIGNHEYDIKYWSGQRDYLKNKLARMN